MTPFQKLDDWALFHSALHEYYRELPDAFHQSCPLDAFLRRYNDNWELYYSLEADCPPEHPPFVLRFVKCDVYGRLSMNVSANPSYDDGSDSGLPASLQPNSVINKLKEFISCLDAIFAVRKPHITYPDYWYLYKKKLFDGQYTFPCLPDFEFTISEQQSRSRFMPRFAVALSALKALTIIAEGEADVGGEIEQIVDFVQTLDSSNRGRSYVISDLPNDPIEEWFFISHEDFPHEIFAVAYSCPNTCFMQQVSPRDLFPYFPETCSGKSKKSALICAKRQLSKRKGFTWTKCNAEVFAEAGGTILSELAFGDFC